MLLTHLYYHSYSILAQKTTTPSHVLFNSICWGTAGFTNGFNHHFMNHNNIWIEGLICLKTLKSVLILNLIQSLHTISILVIFYCCSKIQWPSNLWKKKFIWACDSSRIRKHGGKQYGDQSRNLRTQDLSGKQESLSDSSLSMICL